MAINFVDLIAFFRDVISDGDKLSKFKEVIADVKELVADIKAVIVAIKG